MSPTWRTSSIPAPRQDEALCTEVEQKTGAQIAVVTVNSLEGETSEDYAVDLYKHLGMGSKKNNRGVLLLIAPTERQYRIEVGYGLEPVINDARAGDIGRAMLPSLRSRRLQHAAILSGVTQLANLIAADKGVTTDRPSPATAAARAFQPGLAVVGALLARHHLSSSDYPLGRQPLGARGGGGGRGYRGGRGSARHGCPAC